MKITEYIINTIIGSGMSITGSLFLAMHLLKGRPYQQKTVLFYVAVIGLGLMLTALTFMLAIFRNT